MEQKVIVNNSPSPKGKPPYKLILFCTLWGIHLLPGKSPNRSRALRSQLPSCGWRFIMWLKGSGHLSSLLPSCIMACKEWRKWGFFFLVHGSILTTAHVYSCQLSNIIRCQKDSWVFEHHTQPKNSGPRAHVKEHVRLKWGERLRMDFFPRVPTGKQL